MNDNLNFCDNDGEKENPGSFHRKFETVFYMKTKILHEQN